MKTVLLIACSLIFSISLVKAQGLGSENKSSYLESQKPISEQNSTPYLDLYNSLDSIGKKELINQINKEPSKELQKRESVNNENIIIEDVSFWDAYGKSFVETLFVLISIMIGFALLKLLIKGFKKLGKIKIKDISKHPKTINLKETIMNYFKTMNSKDIIIFSIILGVLVALCLGYSFGNTKYLVRKGLVVSEEVYKEREFSTYLNKYFNFNYILGSASFIITTGVSYLYLSKKGSE